MNTIHWCLDQLHQGAGAMSVRKDIQYNVVVSTELSCDNFVTMSQVIALMQIVHTGQSFWIVFKDFIRYILFYYMLHYSGASKCQNGSVSLAQCL